MTAIAQDRPFEKRLDDFGKELGGFAGKVWAARAKIDLKKFDDGYWQIYQMYSGADEGMDLDIDKLETFLEQLNKVTGKFEVSPQSNLSFDSAVASEAYRKTHAGELWMDFYHVLSTPKPAKKILSRVYVHAVNSPAAVEIMNVIVGQFGKNEGLWEVKVSGPGTERLDTIVAYLYDAESATELVNTLIATQEKKAVWFVDKLPPLVKKAGKGIGTADEPPAIEIYKGGGKRHSFGSFFASLLWIALKTTPDVTEKTADGRHMLDNLLFSLRTLKIDPAKPQSMPANKELEAWFKAVNTPKKK